MNTTVIAHAARQTLEGTAPFSVIAAALLSAGVEYYHVDYVSLQKTFYSSDGTSVTTPIPFEGLPSVAGVFDADALVANIRDSQQNGQPYRAFTHRAMLAGVQGYFAFLSGRRVTYLGRLGDHHTEWFPGAATGTGDAP